MGFEALLVAALEDFVAGRMFPDIAPEGTATPYITFQQVGGTPINFLDATLPSTENARVQVNVWSATRTEASALGKQVESTLRLVEALQTTVLGGRVAMHDAATSLYGTRQDFSFWTD